MHQRSALRTRTVAFTATAGLAASVAIAAGAQAATPTDTTDLQEAVTVDGVLEHLQALQGIADANGGTRQAGTSGHVDSVYYMKDLLDAAGYETTIQPFSYQRQTLVSAEWGVPGETPYELDTDYYPMEGSGTANAAVTPVDLSLGDPAASTSGCEFDDFAGFTAGDIALLQRGACSFEQKALNAIDAGATGVIIFNQGNGGIDRTGMFYGTLGETVAEIPVISTTFDIGVALSETPGLTMLLDVEMLTEDVDTMNLLADTPTGRTDRTVVVGGHLDSVGEGPGINDNGSGTAAILETALQMAALGIEPENRVRFAFWSGEEDGLLGSEYYVSQLSKSELKGTSVNLNFDMVGSPNAVNFVYDGDGDAFGLSGPTGSDVVEDVFTSFFDAAGAPTTATAFDGRSDYLGFIEAGIPAGGLFTGAEGIKSEEEAALYGGTAGLAYDPCYHAACDTIDNVSTATLDIMSDAIAHATLTFADTTSAVSGTAKGKAKGHSKDLEFLGSHAVR
ncbi:M20/M25/M40 family metallo-hydrolase [Demequina lignilytica]|uniref:M20/M25/M40 family metallo-hydrolase n=1 Tax=Demequina lignilytica TaxID=3051663 RepID=A0AB35MHG4_9MICO|nr:M20/M25/M40 family metallo-hydrolase [Demequina sp. SYSU T0a273]MDN4483193.1 M20/M25/M40 family metallo-hydrolase [Demequina sp. SYSU T0a273]